MGYTNYWTMKKDVDRFSDEFVDACKSIVKNSNVKIVDGYGDGDAPEISNSQIWLNGFGENGHETFCLDIGREGFDFCKTARKPYDEVVKAILILASAMGYIQDWSFDGDISEIEFRNAVRLLNKSLGD